MRPGEGRVRPRLAETALGLAVLGLMLGCPDARDPGGPLNELPTSRIDRPAQDTTVTVGGAVILLGTAVDSDGTIESHVWSLGDGTMSIVEDPGSHVYASTGIYTVTYRVADDDGAASVPDTVIVTVQAPPANPNEPSGYTRFAEHTFAALPSAEVLDACDGIGLRAGCWRTFDPVGSLVSLALNADAPSSPPGAFQFRFPEGLPAGSEPGALVGWDGIGEATHSEYREIYESAWIRVPTPDFEYADLVGIKLLGFLGVAKPAWMEGAANQLYFMSWNPGHIDGLVTATWVTLCQQAIADRCMDPNRVTDPTDPFFTFGQWHHYEAVLVLNDIGSANGVYKLWWNGKLVADYSNIVYRDSAHPAGFYGRNWGPTWGGTGARTKTRDDFLQIDHMYLSGIPCDTLLECPQIPPPPPTARIDSPSQDTTVTLGDAVSFLGTGSDADGTIASHSWSFGDGNASPRSRIRSPIRTALRGPTRSRTR